MKMLGAALLLLLVTGTSCLDTSAPESSQSAASPLKCETSFDCGLGSECDDRGACVAQP